MICGHCGTEIADKALICFRCGEPTAQPAARPARAARRPIRRLGPTLLAILLAVAAAWFDYSYGETVPTGTTLVIFILAVAVLGWGLLTRR